MNFRAVVIDMYSKLLYWSVHDSDSEHYNYSTWKRFNFGRRHQNSFEWESRPDRTAMSRQTLVR